MISKGAPFRGLKLERQDFHVLGTPTQAAWQGGGCGGGFLFGRGSGVADFLY